MQPVPSVIQVGVILAVMVGMKMVPIDSEGVALLETWPRWRKCVDRGGWALMFQKCILGPMSHSLFPACWP